jgi:sporulation protein YlmC with PRC-barrel domain
VKAHILKDKPVVSMADGTKIGNVQELLFETGKFRLAALLLSGAGGKSLLPFEAIRSFGADVITVENGSVTQGVDGNLSVGGYRGLRELTSLRVINGEGAWLGDVREVDLDQKGGQVEQLSAHRGGVLGIGGTTVTIPASAIRGIGPKVITVDLPTAAQSSAAPQT